VPGTYTVTASNNPTSPGGLNGVTDGADNPTVLANPASAVKFIFANVPASISTGGTATLNIEAVNSSDAIDTSFNQGVTVTLTGSASGGGLINIVDGIATTTITDAVAENVALGLEDTQSTGLGVTDVASIAFVGPPAPVSGPSTAPSVGRPPTVTNVFSGWAYLGGSISLIIKNVESSAAPIVQPISMANDGSFSVKLSTSTYLVGQTYVLVFTDKTGVVSETKAYNAPAVPQNFNLFNTRNIVIAPTVGFGLNSIVSKGSDVTVQGYAMPKGTVTLWVDGVAIGTITVNNISGQYSYVLSTDKLSDGQHSIAATQTYNGVQSSISSQQTFTVSPLANPGLDFAGTGVIGVQDISIYLSYLRDYLSGITNFNTVDPNILRILDLNHDGKVDAQDISILLHDAGLSQ
jgi:hypothetical protein